MGFSRATALALVVSTSIAQAQPKPTQAQIQQAGDLVKKAIAKSQSGDHALAIELYQQAYNVAPNAVLLSNIGSEYEQSQKPVEAITYFCKYLVEEPTNQFATTHVKALQSQLGNDVEESNPCKVKPKPVVVTPQPPGETPPVTGGGFGPAGGPVAESPSHPGRTLMITGIGVTVIGLVVAGIGLDYGLKGRALQNDIDNHDPHTGWPTEFEGVPILEWNTQGHKWNVDAATYASIGGGVVLIGAVMIGLGVTRHADHETQARVIPIAGAHDAGFALVGSF
jgi:tetratricopeptide (TPR) repeat protein